MKKLKLGTNVFAGVLADLQQIVDTMDIVVDPQAHIDTLQEQHEQLVTLAEQFRTKIAKLNEQQRQKHRVALEILTVRVEALRFKLIEAIETASQNHAAGKLKFGDFDQAIDWNDVVKVDFLENQLIDIAMDFEVNASASNSDTDVVSKVERDIDQAIAAEHPENMNVDLEPVNVDTTENVHEPNDVIQPLPVAQTQANNDIPSASVEQEPNQVANNNEQSFAKAPAEKPTDTSNKVKMSHVIANAMRDNVAFSFDTLLHYNTLSIELMSIPELPEQATPQDIRKLREFITHFIQSCSERRVGTSYFAPVLISSVVAALNQPIFDIWSSQMMGQQTTLASIRNFLTQQEERLASKDYVNKKFQLARAIKAAKEMVKGRAPSNPNPLTVPVDQVAVMSKANKVATSFELPSSHNRGRPEYGGAAHSRSRESSASSKNARKGGEQKKVPKCFRCAGNHPLFKCQIFLGASMTRRWNYVNENRICPLCLVDFHSPLDCGHGLCKNHADDPNADAVHNSTLCTISQSKKQPL